MCNELLGLPETAETWSRVLDNRDVIKICLPELKAIGMTPGKIFSYAEAMVQTVPCRCNVVDYGRAVSLALLYLPYVGSP